MERTSKRILESIIRMDIMPCSHCAMVKTCDIYKSTTKDERMQERQRGEIAHYGNASLCLKYRWFRFLKEQTKGIIYDLQIT